IFLVELLQGNTGIVLLAALAKRHAELQQVIDHLRAVGIFLIALGESDRGILIVLARVIGFAQPILRITRQRITGMVFQKGLQRALGLLILALLQETDRIFVLVLGCIPRQADIAGTAAAATSCRCGCSFSGTGRCLRQSLV